MLKRIDLINIEKRFIEHLTDRGIKINLMEKKFKDVLMQRKHKLILMQERFKDQLNNIKLLGTNTMQIAAGDD